MTCCKILIHIGSHDDEERRNSTFIIVVEFSLMTKTVSNNAVVSISEGMSVLLKDTVLI